MNASNRKSLTRRVLVSSSFGLLLACGPPAAVLPAPLDRAPSVPLSGPEREQAIADLRRAEEQPRSFVAEHVLDALDVGSGRGGRLAGVLAVARPDRFRLRSIGPAGLTVLDLVFVRGAYRAVTAGGRETVRGRVGRGHAPRGVPVDAIARAFLSRLAGAHVAAVERTRRARVVVLRTGSTEQRVSLALRGSDVLEERSLHRGRERLRLRYFDYRPIADGARAPFRIAWAQAEPALRATITVRRYTVGATLPAATFALDGE